MDINYFILFTISLQMVYCYSNKHFTIVRPDITEGLKCAAYPSQQLKHIKQWTRLKQTLPSASFNGKRRNFTFATMEYPAFTLRDPIINFERIIHQVVYGKKAGAPKLRLKDKAKKLPSIVGLDYLGHLPTGQAMRAETFQNKSSVHLVFREYVHRGHAFLKVTQDHMQTAVDAFAILLAGNLDDVMRLPPAYVLQSARTIAMMRIAREKLAAMWHVIKGDTPTVNVSYLTLEKFRPLFKYVNGKEIARLNLTDKKILTYIGTHPDLTRHQVGVVANTYLRLNPNWSQPRYLNLMNNLLCGVPIIYMRRIPEDTYLQLTHQLFYHIRACDPLQRKFYLQMMTRTQALGKSYSWSARDVSRLGLLLAEVNGQSLSSINPEAMAGIASQVMLQMQPENLQHITEMQLRYIQPKSLNVLARKLRAYEGMLDVYGKSIYSHTISLSLILLCVVIIGLL